MPRERVAALLLIASGLFCALLPERAGGVLLHGLATRAAVQQVDAAFEQNQNTFLQLTAAKAAAAVVEGSSVGVGFALEVGDVMQPVLDLIHFFWRLLLFSLLLLGTYKLLLETGILGLGFAALGAGLVAWGLALLAPGRRGLRGAARFLVLAGLLLAWLVPAALLATHWLGSTYTRDLELSYRRQIAAFGEDLVRAKDSVLDPEHRAPWYRPGERVEDFRTRLAAAARFVSERFEAVLPSFTFYALLQLFDHLLLPLGSAWILYRLAALAVTSLPLRDTHR